jgi:L-rhamnose 1-dehydrogenase
VNPISLKAQEPMHRRLEGKVALVTGASRGIGRAIALRLAQEGASVAVNHPGEPKEARDVVRLIRSAGGHAISVRADVASKRQVDRMVAQVIHRFGQIDILVNNAGICPFAEFLDITEETWDRTHDVNLKGVFLCSQAVARHMVERGVQGRIISISSMASYVGGIIQAHYCPTKAGINLLMRSMATALGPHGITCNTVLPGTVLTDMNSMFLSDPEHRRQTIEHIPLRRLGEPKDVAAVVAFLASDDAGYMSGAELLVDGGAFASFQ